MDEQPARQTLAARVGIGIGIGIGIENSLMSSRAPLLPETHFHAETPRRGWNTPSSPVSSLRTASMLKHETKTQES